MLARSTETDILIRIAHSSRFFYGRMSDELLQVGESFSDKHRGILDYGFSIYIYIYIYRLPIYRYVDYLFQSYFALVIGEGKSLISRSFVPIVLTRDRRYHSCQISFLPCWSPLRDQWAAFSISLSRLPSRKFVKN